MDILSSSLAGGFFSIFGWGFLAGAMFATVIVLVFDWINNRTKNYKAELATLEVPSEYQS